MIAQPGARLTLIRLAPFAIEDLEFAVEFAAAVEAGHAAECPRCEGRVYDGTCERGVALERATEQAQARLAAALSQVPERHITPGTATRRRLERDWGQAA
jgi:hypothetical protein